MPDPLSWSHAAPWMIAAFFGGYFLGSVPVSIVISRLFSLPDPRTVGSGNIGATNVLRSAGPVAAVFTLLLDAGKGALAFWLGGLEGPDMAFMAGLAVILGHVFPIWLKFRGGRGVAPSLGILLALSPLPTLLVFLGFFVVLVAFGGYVSLASLAGAILSPVIFWFWFADPQIFLFTLSLSLLVVIRHWSNILRLLRGEESAVKAFRWFRRK